MKASLKVSPIVTAHTDREPFDIRLSDGQVDILASRISERADPNRWRTKSNLAFYFSCSVRTVEQWKAEGMPSATLAGKVVFRVDEAEDWLRQTGRLDLRGDRAGCGKPASRLDSNPIINPYGNGGASTPPLPADTEG